MTDEALTAAPEEAPEAVMLAPTSAAAWPKKAKAGILVTLPSGAVARIAAPPIPYLYLTGQTPPKIASFLRKEGLGVLSDPMDKMSDEQRRLFMDWMIAASFVEPKVSMTRKADALYIGDVIEHDKAAVMSRLNLSIEG